MRLIAAIFCAGLALVMLPGAGQAPPPARVQFSDAEKTALDRLSAYLNSVRSLKSGFIQLGPDGQLDQGEFYLQKPGKLRFEYFPPSPTLIVATGGHVYVKNAELNTVDRYDLSDTPLGLLLNEDVDLKRNSAVTGVEIRNDALILHARTSSNRQQGNIALAFAWPVPELRQWTVKDNQGGTTTVALRGLSTGVSLDDALFAVPVKAPALKKTP